MASIRWPERSNLLRWRAGTFGDPLIEDTAAWFECGMHDQVEAGDHLILIGRVRSYGHSPASPLGYCRGAYVSFQLEQEVVASRSRRTRVGAVLEHLGRVVFLSDAAMGRLLLPSGRGLGSAHEPESLRGRLAAHAIEFDLDFLYSVYEDEAADTLNVYYRGAASVVPERREIELCPLDAIPFDRLEDSASRTLLRRYAKERLESRFTIYAGNAETGSYRAIADIAGREGSDEA